MDQTEAGPPPEQKYLTVRQAAFIGVGAMVGTGIFALLGAARQLPRAMYLALGIATVIYIAIALGVFGTLTVEKVISSGGTALAVAAGPRSARRATG